MAGLIKVIGRRPIDTRRNHIPTNQHVTYKSNILLFPCQILGREDSRPYNTLGINFELCIMNYALCIMHCALCIVHCALRIMHYFVKLRLNLSENSVISLFFRTFTTNYFKLRILLSKITA